MKSFAIDLDSSLDSGVFGDEVEQQHDLVEQPTFALANKAAGSA